MLTPEVHCGEYLDVEEVRQTLFQKAGGFVFGAVRFTVGRSRLLGGEKGQNVARWLGRSGHEIKLEHFVGGFTQCVVGNVVQLFTLRSLSELWH